MKKLFVWDFHGVLEKDNEKALVEISNSALAKFNYKERFSIKDINYLYGLRWFQYFEYLLPNKPQEHYFELVKESIKIQETHPEIIIKNIKPNNHSHFILRKIHNSQHSQILISNTASSQMNIFLGAVKLEHYFDHIFTIDTHTSFENKSKKDILKNFLETSNFNKIVIIGDSPRDIALKEIKGGITYLYSHPNKEFRDCKADYKINDLREILKEI